MNDNTDIVSETDLTLDEESLDLPDLDEAGFDTGSAELAETEEDAISLDMSEEATAEAADEIEFDLSETGAVDNTDKEEEFSLDIEMAELDADIQHETASELEAKEASLDITDIELDDNDLDLSAAEESEAVAEEDEVTLDLSDEFDLDSLEMGEVEAADVKTAANETLEDEDDFDLSSLGDVDEISTKLDLARAYLDMGDSEGTRGILEEVLADGNDEQKQEASELMAKLG
jgi:pilus assembly protein FimV